MRDQPSAPVSDHVHQMDRMYRYTRHVYDATRRYYLLGRDRLLREMEIRPGDRVLEMGCGTARNLIQLQGLHPQALLYGLDASRVMLETAERSTIRGGCGGRVTFRQCLAEQMDYQRTFGLESRFDVIFFSYSLSMMPTWPLAIEAALANLMPAGRIYIVDFWDQAGLPQSFAWLLKRWLALFYVEYRPELMTHLEKLAADGRCRLKVESVGGRYAYIAKLEQPELTIS